MIVYGHYITDTIGNEHFFVEGCSYCRMSTGGLHEPNCPMKDIKVADRLARILNIRQVRILKYDDGGNFIKEL